MTRYLSNKVLKDLPTAGGVYQLMLGKELLYVGQTSNFQERWKYHHLTNRQLSCIDFTRIKIELLGIKKPKERKEIEKQLIITLKPCWNIEFNSNFIPSKHLQFIAFCIKRPDMYGRLQGKSYKDPRVGRYLLRIKSFAYGDIPAELIKHEWILEKVKIKWPFNREIILKRISDSIESEKDTKLLDTLLRWCNFHPEVCE